ncbi:MAG: hypothetical protein ACOX24_07930 [Christensenellales bacterium]|jgi:hypothetical protein
MYNPSLENSLDNLLKEWKLKYPDSVFISDGIVNKEKWKTQKVRPLFLLKEAYGGDSDWDLIDDYLSIFINDSDNTPIKDKTWKRVVQWTHGIFNTNETTLAQLPSSFSDISAEWLNSIAVVNVKKANGKDSSNKTDINGYAERDREFLKRQIELIDPTVIICGSTISSLNIIMCGEENEGVRNSDNKNDDWCYFTNINAHKVIVLDYYHPGQRSLDTLHYFRLTYMYQKALQNINS